MCADVHMTGILSWRPTILLQKFVNKKNHLSEFVCICWYTGLDLGFPQSLIYDSDTTHHGSL